MKTIIANWKMYLGVRESVALSRGVLRGLRGMKTIPEVILAPSYPALGEVSKILSRSRVRLSAQNMSHQDHGAYTGDVSSRMLKELGVNAVILGHSERRAKGQVDSDVHLKLVRAVAEGIDPIVCVGEPSATHEAGETEGYVHEQISTIFEGVETNKRSTIYVAYEPLWAIGSGKTPSIHDVETVHAMIREQLEELGIDKVSVLYGGSVDPENAYEFLNNSEVDGVLIGGAGVRIQKLLDIITVASEIKA